MPDRSTAPAAHILTYARALQGGGVERAQLRLAADWLAAGRRVTLVLGTDTGPLAAELPPGIETILLGSPNYRALLSLPRHSRALDPDVIFCAGSYYTGVAAWTRWRLGARCPPIVAQLSNAIHRADHSPLVALGHRQWLKLHRRFIDRLVAMTPATRDEAIAAMRFPAARMAVIPNPPTRHVAGAPPVALPNGRFLLGLGRLEPQKRWDRLIAALPKLADQSVTLMILGEGGERDRLETMAADLGLSNRIMLPGHVLDPTPAIKAATALVLTSDFEGVPGVLRESLAHGTPVVTTESTVAVHEIVASPDRGSVVPIGDADALVSALDHWLEPGRARPAPTPEPGAHAAADYLALFDTLAAQRRR